MNIYHVIDRLKETDEFRRMEKISSLGAKCRNPMLNRFNHSIGVCSVTFDLLRTVTPKMQKLGIYDKEKENAVVVAALLHDIGHAPLSHSFERIAKSFGCITDHEEWTNEIILGDTDTNKILRECGNDFPQIVSDMINPNGEKSFYHMLISSQFDADRIDYLKRDAMFQPKMIYDFNYAELRNALTPVKLGDGSVAMAFSEKSQDALREFFMCRFLSYKNNYISENEAEIEYKVEASIMKAAKLSENKNHPMVRFFDKNNQTLKNYLELNESSVMELSEKYINHMLLANVHSSKDCKNSSDIESEKRINNAEYSKNIYNVKQSCVAYNNKKNLVYITTEDGRLINFGDVNKDLANMYTETNVSVLYTPKVVDRNQIMFMAIQNQKIYS